MLQAMKFADTAAEGRAAGSGRRRTVARKAEASLAGVTGSRRQHALLRGRGKEATMAKEGVMAPDRQARRAARRR